jgi:bifunctional UDP-N-acetylglucosamine pyrophosphorylase/glucosamine-1-phosphate N-acetyltransferase
VTAGKTPLSTTHFSTVILAAGIGKRMRSPKPKVLHEILGKPMLAFVVDAAQNAGSSEIVLVVGKQADSVKKVFKRRVVYARQPVPLGTGDAAQRGIQKATHRNILVLNGDIPLLQHKTILEIIENHRKTNADLTFLSCDMKDPFGYGRVVRKKNKVIAIVEHRDATALQRTIREINVGVYYGGKTMFLNTLNMISTQNDQEELYLTDVVHLLLKRKKRVIGVKITDEEQVQGINTKTQLNAVRAIVKHRWAVDTHDGKRSVSKHA